MKRACILLLFIGTVLTSPSLLAQTKASYQFVDQKPKPSKELKSLQRYLQRNILYPKEARENNITGTVVYQVVIDDQGRISDVKILKDIGGGCGDAVKKALESYDKRWTPAEKDGLPVKAYFTGTFSFSIQ